MNKIAALKATGAVLAVLAFVMALTVAPAAMFVGMVITAVVLLWRCTYEAHK